MITEVIAIFCFLFVAAVFVVKALNVKKVLEGKELYGWFPAGLLFILALFACWLLFLSYSNALLIENKEVTTINGSTGLTTITTESYDFLPYAYLFQIGAVMGIIIAGLTLAEFASYLAQVLSPQRMQK